MYKYFILLSLTVLSLTVASSSINVRLPMIMGITFNEQITCNFDSNFCLIKSDYNMAKFDVRKDSLNPILGQISMLILNTSTAGYHQASRLLSPYFPTKSQNYGCLKIHYLMYGPGAKVIYLIQQDQDNTCIWQKNNDPSDTERIWREATFTIDLRNGDPRFFIEVHIDPRSPQHGIVAFSEISFAYTPCEVNYTQECGADEPPPPPNPV